jgi:3-dehydroquinate synthase
MFFIYGPPLSGKTTLAARLARQLDLPLVDLDARITAEAGLSIPQLFERYGEAGFRQRESQALRQLSGAAEAVVALGGGALLDHANRRLAESLGGVLCLEASLDTLLARLAQSASDRRAGRPLLDGNPETRLRDLLAARRAHYASFPRRLTVDRFSPEELVSQAQAALGAFRLRQMPPPYDVRIQPGGLDQIGQALQARGQNGPFALVTDENIAPQYAGRVRRSLEAAGQAVEVILLPPGEAHKTIHTASVLWERFTRAGLERRSTVLALGGGVIGDLAGFAASAYLRGVEWVNLPTSLLAMVDASLGGKTGIDLPQGKNLVGAFHAPRLVLADPDVLATLPPAELRSGLAEVVKHGLIADPGLFELCAAGLPALSRDWPGVISRAVAVKARIVEADPYEKGLRAALNLGHTVGHAVEQASAYSLRHGEAIAIGLVAEARLAVRLGLAETALPEQIAACLQGLGLPVAIPAGLDPAHIRQAMDHDKKRTGGRQRFALPAAIGRVQVGVEADWPGEQEQAVIQ